MRQVAAGHEVQRESGLCIDHSCGSRDRKRGCLFSSVDSVPDFELWVPVGSPSRGGDVEVYVFDINQPSLPTPFYSVLVSGSVFTALSPAFHSIHSPDNSPLFHSVLLVLICLSGPFNCIYLSMKVSLSPDIILFG